MFSNPAACHLSAEALHPPLLVLCSKGGRCAGTSARRLSAGHAAKANDMPLVSLQPTSDVTKVAKANHAFTIKVDKVDKRPWPLKGQSITSGKTARRH
jgi:acetolactate synthase-1/2/3 large subunit